MNAILKLAPEPLRRAAEHVLRSDSHGARSGRGAIAAFFIRVASAAVMFISQVLFARWLGARDFGVFTFVLVLINVLGTLSTLGFATSVVRFLPEYREAREPGLARGFLLSGSVIVFGAGAAAMVAGLVVLYAFEGSLPDYQRLPVALGLLSLPAFALTDYQDGVGRSQGWLGLALAPPYIVRPCIILALIGLGVAAGLSPNAETAVLAASTAIWITALAQYVFLSRRLSGTLAPAAPSYAPKTWFQVSLPLLLLEGFALLILNLDILLLDIFVPPDQVGFYFAAARTVSLIAFIHFAVSAAAMPRFAALHSAGEIDRVRTTLAESRKWTFWPSLAVVAAILVLGKPLLWLFGPEFTGSYPVMFVLVVGLLARAAAGPTQGLLVMTGYQNRTALVMGLAVALNLVLNLILIPAYGIMGAAAATSAALTVEALALCLMARRTLVTTGMALAPRSVHGTAAQ